MIKHVRVQLHRAYPDGVIWKNWNLTAKKLINEFNFLYLKECVSKRRRSEEKFCYKSIKVHTFTSAYRKATWLLLTCVKMCSWNWEELKNCWSGIFDSAQKSRIFQHQHLRQVKMFIFLFLFHHLFLLKYVFRYSISLISLNKKDLLGLIQKRSKVLEKNMSRERTLSFDQWKTFSKYYKSIGVWLWLLYKVTENNFCLWRVADFIQTQKRHPISLDKIGILAWGLLVISIQHFSCDLNSLVTYF